MKLFRVIMALCLGGMLNGVSLAADAVRYRIGDKATVQALYPDASWLPAEYAHGYQDLAKTIEHFTLSSLARDGLANAKVRVSFPQVDGVAQVELAIEPATPISRRYATVHPAWLGGAHAQAALKGVKACQAATSPACWDPKPRAGQPWAFFLPLGLPMVSQKSLMFMDYPPLPALTGQDYLYNYTLCRWSRVLGAAGVQNPVAHETIVDARPIAAPGSGEDAIMPVPGTWFDNARTGAYYLTPMLQLLSEKPLAEPGTKAPATRAGRSLPVAVFGATPRATWAQIVKRKSLAVLEVGETRLGGQSRVTPWIASNHPDVTTYNCCPGDPAASCKGSYDLVKDEQQDFVVACWLDEMSGPDAPSAAVAKQRCAGRWQIKPRAAARQAVCIQAKLDNNNRAAQCKSYQDAWSYCSANAGNACASYDCNYDPARIQRPVPPESARPVGWADTCNRAF